MKCGIALRRESRFAPKVIATLSNSTLWLSFLVEYDLRFCFTKFNGYRHIKAAQLRLAFFYPLKTDTMQSANLSAIGG